MGKLRAAGQSIIEYVVILVIVAVASLWFLDTFLKPGGLNLFSGYVANATGAMQ